MSIFEEVTLEWGGKKYKIPPDQLMKAIAKVEDVITFNELSRHREAGTAPVAKLAMAYGVLLRHAGANVTDDEVYGAVFSVPGTAERFLPTVTALVMIMIPPSALKAISGAAEASTAGKPQEPPKAS